MAHNFSNRINYDKKHELVRLQIFLNTYRSTIMIILYSLQHAWLNILGLIKILLILGSIIAVVTSSKALLWMYIPFNCNLHKLFLSVLTIYIGHYTCVTFRSSISMRLRSTYYQGLTGMDGGGNHPLLLTSNLP